MFSNFISIKAEFVKILGPTHLLYLAFCIFTVFMFIKNHTFIKKHKNKLCKIFFCTLLFQQIFLLYGWYAFATPVFLAEGLPLQLCRIASILTLVFLITKKEWVLNILCYFSVYALISLFYPLHVFNFTHISGISYMINHIITVLIPVFAVIAYNWYPSWKSYVHAVIAFTIYLPVAIIANYFTGGNYFYQVDRPFLHNVSSFVFAMLTYFITVGAYALLTYIVILLKKLYVKNKKSKSLTV